MPTAHPMPPDPFDLDAFDFGDVGGAGVPDAFDAFDLDAAAPRSEREAETSWTKPRLYVGARRSKVKYDHAAALARDLGASMLAGERVDALVSGNFIFGDLLEALAVEHDLFIDDLTLSTLAIGQENVDSFRNLLEGGYLRALTIVASDYWYAHNRANAVYTAEALTGVLAPDGSPTSFRLAVAGTHTKVNLLRIAPSDAFPDGQRLVLHGSANLRSSRSVEVFTAETDADLYAFHHAWHSRIADHYAIARKAPRASALFDLL